MKPTRPLREASLPPDGAKNSPAGARLWGAGGAGVDYTSSMAARGVGGAQSGAELSFQTLGSHCQAPDAGRRPSSSYYLASKPDVGQSERGRGG